jgi:hypothetical protein
MKVYAPKREETFDDIQTMEETQAGQFGTGSVEPRPRKADFIHGLQQVRGGHITEWPRHPRGS